MIDKKLAGAVELIEENREKMNSNMRKNDNKKSSLKDEQVTPNKNLLKRLHVQKQIIQFQKEGKKQEPARQVKQQESEQLKMSYVDMSQNEIPFEQYKTVILNPADY